MIIPQEKFLFRIAPTPSGFIHEGNACNFLLIWLMARSVGARIMLRIDDLDRERFRKQYLDNIFKTIEYLGIDYDVGPSGPDEFTQVWSQLNRIDLYSKNIEFLSLNPLSYSCSCSRMQFRNGLFCGCKGNLDEKNTAKGQNRRIRLNYNTDLEFTDFFMNQKVRFHSQLDTAPVFQKRNGLPSYHLASISDDIYFGVSHIVRGLDLLDTSIIQRGLARAMRKEEYNRILLAHHPLIKNDDGNKLSKSTQKNTSAFNNDIGWNNEEICIKVSRWLKLPDIGNLNELFSAARFRCSDIVCKTS